VAPQIDHTHSAQPLARATGIFSSHVSKALFRQIDGSPKQLTDQVRDQQSDRGDIGRGDEHTAITRNSLVRSDTSKPGQ
jgi:hypothetical protein